MIEVSVVYQDCAMCGSKGRKVAQKYAEKGIIFRKVGFASPEGRDLCARAVKQGIGTMPFYVHNGQFATTLDAFISKKGGKSAKKANKTRKNSKIKEANGDTK